ncbi:YegP family protein [Williamsia sp. D3]|uniref:DUF1508 domain-containing protein n=1 Tax=Williamsia sp. D3 TaxID=1313067 RepID=UPI0003D30BD3|nr:YegP family protein [Williamsia sp. D3]ETD31244.1 hypothetical protein W823_19170 [Williamsia sp. D3]
MIVHDNPAGKITRGTIVVYSGVIAGPGMADWYWRAKARNGSTLAQGEGYARRDRCLSTLDSLFGTRSTFFDLGKAPVTPWRLVVEKRDGTVDWIGQIQ